MLREVPVVLRSLLRRPAFTVTVVVTLALGLGANAALFSLVDAVMLRPLPYPDAEELVSLRSTVTRGESVEERSLSYPDFEDVRNGIPAFSGVAAWNGSRAILTGGEAARLLVGERISEDYLDVLGVGPLMGPGFSDAGTDQVIVGHELWQRELGGSPDVIGSTLSLTGTPRQVVGVMPPGFAGLGEDAEYWLRFGEVERFERGNRFLGAVARLEAGDEDTAEKALEQANVQLRALFSRLEDEYPEPNTGYSAVATSLRDAYVGDLERPVALLLGSVGLLLLIASANVANLLLVRRVRERRAAAIRLALGAGAGDLLRRNVVEAGMLGLLGGGLGLLVASWGTALLLRLSPVELPAFATVSVDDRTLLFGLALALGVGVILGAATALRMRRGVAPDVLRQGAASGEDSGRGGARGFLMAAEVALALVVALGALATLGSWNALLRIEPGFEARAAVFRVFLPEVGEVPFEEPATRDPAYAALREEVRRTAASLPGVEEVALASDAPLQGGYAATVVSAEGAEPREEEPYGGGVRTYRHIVSEDYFDALGIPIVHGRGFRDTVHDSTPVAVISQRLAERLFPGVDDPLGHRFKLGTPATEEDLAAYSDDPAESPWIEVAGLVGEVRHRNLVPDPERISEDPDLYLPMEQWPRRGFVGIVRTAAASAPILPTLQQKVGAIHAEMPVYQLGTLEENLSGETARIRFGSVLMSLFAVLSVLLAAVGIYGVMAYRVSARTREIGVRIALGARPRRVVRRVLREGLATAVAGLALGIALVWAGVRWLAAGRFHDLLYGVDPTDPRLALAAAALLLGVAALACVVPALRASRVDPVVALREE